MHEFIRSLSVCSLLGDYVLSASADQVSILSGYC